MADGTSEIRKLIRPNTTYSDYSRAEIDAICAHPQFDALMAESETNRQAYLDRCERVLFEHAAKEAMSGA